MPLILSAVFARLLLTALFWGGTWIAGRVAVQEAAPLFVASWRFFLATVALGILLHFRERLPRWAWRDWFRFVRALIVDGSSFLVGTLSRSGGG